MTILFLARQALQPPRFTERPHGITVREGEPVTFQCRASGVPAPVMSWQKDGYMITQSDHHYRVDNEDGRSVLTIDRAAGTDSAWYQCTAVNVAGTASNRAKLIVQGRRLFY